MKLSDDWDDFKEKSEMVHPKPSGQEVRPLELEHEATGRRRKRTA